MRCARMQRGNRLHAKILTLHLSGCGEVRWPHVAVLTLRLLAIGGLLRITHLRLLLLRIALLLLLRITLLLLRVTLLLLLRIALLLLLRVTLLLLLRITLLLLLRIALLLSAWIVEALLCKRDWHQQYRCGCEPRHQYVLHFFTFSCVPYCPVYL